ncbi:probable transcription-associated protein 1 [Culex quinquefasciatus]|uniref:probable transcription-associated protein 1 n=1 Tax=Culex quinquefasciatus TaxID=7176 RepID=UPI0018E37F3D|nr:probable transcription-associated protein 1 [Culex quinquefasciatus]
MSKYRRNAVVIDYNVLPVRTDIESVSKFIINNLELDLKKVNNIQLNNSRNHVIIELGSPEEAWDLAEQHNLRHKVEGELAYVVYNQQVKTCRHCGKPLHQGKKCAESSTISPTTTTTTTPAQPPPTTTKPSQTLSAPSPSATETAPDKTPPKIATTTIEPTTSDDEHHTKPTESDQTNFQSNLMDISSQTFH